MKNRCRFACAALMLILFFTRLSGIVSAADESGRNVDYARVADETGQLSDAERETLEKDCIRIVTDYGVDVALLSVGPERLAQASLEEIGAEQYENGGFGYGETGDCFMVVFEAQSGEASIFTFGRASERIPRIYLDQVADGLAAYYESYGIFGMMYAAERHIASYLKDHGANSAASSDAPSDPAATSGAGTAPESAGKTGSAQTAAEPGGPSETPNERVGEGSDLPAWYPADRQNFVFYHDETRTRVVDDADIFTAEEEAAMEARLKEIRSETDRDIVVYTNLSAAGLGHDIMAADFYDFNGYGCGESYEGVCLYICMDPSDRGWWTACTGPDTMGLYTKDAANELDDALYPYMAGGDYGTGVRAWIENFRTLYLKGAPFAPDWLPARGSEPPARFHDGHAPRVTDAAGLMEASEISELTEQAKRISDTYGIDVVIHTAKTSAGLDGDLFAERFYQYNGFGFGPDYDGILMVLFNRPGNMPDNRIYASGKGLDRLTAVNLERMRDAIRDRQNSGKYYEAAATYLRQLDHMKRTGRVPRSVGYWIFISVLGALAGLVFGAISLSRASRRMTVPQTQENADQYLVAGSLNLTVLGDQFVRTSTSRRYIQPVSKSSGGSGSSGGSTYRSSYTGSSGRSHSGSGRRF